MDLECERKGSQGMYAEYWLGAHLEKVILEDQDRDVWVTIVEGEIYEWELHLERCVSCNMECLNKNWIKYELEVLCPSIYCTSYNMVAVALFG
jgi:hypothetical protein